MKIDEVSGLFAVLFSLCLVSGCENTAAGLAVVGTVERDRIELVAQTNEPITVVHVAEGDPVKAGDIILEQDRNLYLAGLEQLRAARDRTGHRLAELIRGPRREDIEAARARLQGAISNLAVQEREYERINRLVQDKLASPSLLDKSLELREAARSERDQARAHLDALLAGTTPEELDQARASLEEADAALKRQEILLERLAVTAPANGIVDSLLYEQGERPAAGDTVAVLLAEGTPYARVYIPEPIRSRVTPGTAARIAVDGLDRILCRQSPVCFLGGSFYPLFRADPQRPQPSELPR